MSENINFISANELPLAEGDEVSVLCIENGELKQKAASGLGGNANYDIVVRITNSYDEDTDDVSATGEIISGSFEAVVQKLDEAVMPVGLVIANGTRWGGREIKTVREFIPEWGKNPGEDESIYVDMDGFGYILFADGTVGFD